MTKICELVGVREYGEGDPVELWRNETNGRLVIRAYNERQNNFTDVDLWDLLAKLSVGDTGRLPEDHTRA
jgi:hypothetical protein